MLSQFGERGMIKKSLEFGAEGYLLKDCGSNELLKAIRTVICGGTYFNTNTYNPKQLKYEYKPVKLSNREYEILCLIARDKKCKEIAQLLDISISTVRTYRNRLLMKSGNNTIAGLVQWANNNNIL